MKRPSLMDQATFIGGHRKSGTTLLICLLDSHPELATLPIDSGFFYGIYPPYYISDCSLSQKKKKVIDFVFKGKLKQEIDYINTETTADFPFEDLNRTFCRKVDMGSGSPKEILEAMVSAFIEVAPIPKEINKRWVEKTTSSEIYAIDIFNWYPKAKFIHVIRDPRDNFASLKSGWHEKYSKANDGLERLLQSLIDRGKYGMQLAQYNKSLFGEDKYFILKFEDLAGYPEKTMKSLAKFLCIEFDEILLKPTVCGNLWKGNNFDGKTFDSVSDQNVNKWMDRISHHEAKVIEFHFRDLMDQYGYKQQYSLKEQVNSAKEHYKWFNYTQIYSIKI